MKVARERKKDYRKKEKNETYYETLKDESREGNIINVHVIDDNPEGYQYRIVH